MLLRIYSLENCPYSEQAEIKFKAYNPDVIKVSQLKKNEYKKMNGMNTFPQIFLVDGNEKIKIGGYNDTIDLLAHIFKNETINYPKDKAEKLQKFFLNK
jgi:glutaredoxin